MLQTNQHDSDRNYPIVIGVLLVVTIIAVVFLIGSMSDASADESTALTAGWQVIFEDDFEAGIKGDWTVADVATNGEYYWATSTYTASQGTTSVWATGGGDEGSGLTPGTDDYPSNALSSMSAGPFDVSDATGIRLAFDFWTETEEVLDNLLVYGSSDGSSYSIVETYDGSSNGWQSDTVDFNDFVGNSQFWFKFTFSSNATEQDLGVFLDDVRLELSSGVSMFMPIVNLDPTPTPTPIPVYSYHDDFSDPNSGWPIRDNTHVDNDCFRWFYDDGTYNAYVCDDRTDIKASPKISLPDEDYEIEVRSRFENGGGFNTSYAIMFDAKSHLGEYYLVWVLWQNSGQHLWTIMRDETNNRQTLLFDWTTLEGNVYDYSDSGTAFNTWNIIRTDNQIAVSVNGHHIRTVNEARPSFVSQYLFGLYTATHETGTVSNPLETSFDYFKVDVLSGNSVQSQQAFPSSEGGFYSSGPFELEHLLPGNDD